MPGTALPSDTEISRRRKVNKMVLPLAHVFSLTIQFGLITPVSPIQWIFIALMNSTNTVFRRQSCDEVGNRLNHRQVQVCKRHTDIMNSVKYGASMAASECQYQFRHRRWNCTTAYFDKSPVFGNSANGGIREVAFMHSISSAGVAYAVTRSCTEGNLLSKCGCDKTYNGMSEMGWQWGGCSDDIDFGINFSRTFVDAQERGKKAGKPSRVLMNLHNNNAGRWAVKKLANVQCKCHGMTGSCNIKTCWRSLPNFRLVGDHTKEKFDGATKVEAKLIGSRRVLVPQNNYFKPHMIDDLVYLDVSPDFCNVDSEAGLLGTRGRYCNRTSKAIDGCGLLCCNRGYSTHLEFRVNQCLCRFQWCCSIRCKKCQKSEEVSVCN
ncbi:protein Wnt-4-like isoform X1 [Montipora capricornis]|uniref:protein Wnt-4-like isoform X2 n=2 Tax=Montipora foliosa TaxID=591990 RepID=UPI0035F1901D